MKQVITTYVKEHPIKFVLEVLIVALLSYWVEAVTGGICLFKYGKINIQDISEQFYFMAGTDLRLSTEFLRQSALLPLNEVGNNMCTYDSDDICHLYLNPDKTNISNMFVTVHFMNNEEQTMEYEPKYDKVLLKTPDGTIYKT
jgi:hypothetical protein